MSRCDCAIRPNWASTCLPKAWFRLFRSGVKRLVSSALRMCGACGWGNGSWKLMPPDATSFPSIPDRITKQFEPGRELAYFLDAARDRILAEALGFSGGFRPPVGARRALPQL